MPQGFRKSTANIHFQMMALRRFRRLILLSLGLIFGSVLPAQSVVVKSVPILGKHYPITTHTDTLTRTFVGKVTRVLDEQLKEKYGSAELHPQKSSVQHLPLGKLSLDPVLNPQPVVTIRSNPQFERLSGNMSVLGSNYAIFNLDIEHGLGSNEVSAMHFAANGDIWIGYGTGGVSCLRGQRIINLGEREGFDNSGITTIRSFGESVWVGSFGGGLYRVTNGQVERWSRATGFPTDHVMSLEAFDGMLWIGTYSAGILAYDGSKFLKSSPSMAIPPVVGFLAADSSYLYIGSLDSTVLRLDHDQGLSQLQLKGLVPGNATLGGLELDQEGLHLLYADGDHIQLNGSVALHYSLPSQQNYQAMCSDHRGGVWIGDAMGKIWHSANNRLKSITHDEGLSRSGVQVLGEDVAGNVWIGSSRHGVFVVANSAFQVVLAEENELFASTDAIADHPDGLLFHTQEGISLLKPDKSLWHLQHPYFSSVSGILVIGEKIWISSFRGIMELSGDSLFRYELGRSKEQGFNSNLGLSASRDSKTIYLSNYNFGCLIWDIETHVMTLIDSTEDFSLVQHTFEDDQGRLWIGSPKGGVSFIEDGRRTVVVDTYGEVHTFAEDKLGNVWIGTKYGLLQYGRNGKLTQHQFAKTGGQNEIRSLLYLPQFNQLWVGTAAGLWRYDLQTQMVLAYGTAHGVGGTYFERNAAVQSGQSIYWINNKGLLQYVLDASATAAVPNLQLSGLDLQQIDGKTDWVAGTEQNIHYDRLRSGVPENLSLPADATQLIFYFSTGRWFAATDYKLHYQLDGSDHWAISDDNHVVMLDHLQPQRYSVKFKVVMPDGHESNVVSYTFEIRKPFYLEVWFILLTTILGGGLGYLVIRRILRIRFENIRSYSDRDTYLKRMRVMGVLLSVGLPLSFFAESMLGIQGYNSQMFFWLFLVFLSGIAIWVSTFVGKLGLNSLRKIVWVSATSMMLYVSVYTDMSNYAPTFTIGFIVVFCFAAIIFDSLRAFASFAFMTAAMLAYLLIWIDTNNPDHLLFLTNFPLAFLFGATYHFLQLYRISNILFADKVLSVYDKYVLVCNGEGEIVYCNEYVTNELGVANEQVLGTGWWQRASSANRSKAQISQAVKARIGGDTSTVVFEKQLSIASFPQARSIDWEYQLIEGGYLMGIGTDVTERIEQDLRIKTLSLVASTTESIVIITGLDRRIEWVNQSFTNITGYTLEEVIGEKPGALLHGPDTDPATVSAISAALGAGRTFKGEIRNYDKSGKPYWIMLVIQPLVEDDGRLLKFASLSTDITARKLKELEMIKAVAESEHKYRLIADNTSDGIAILEPDGHFAFVSPSFLKILGYPVSTFLGAGPSAIISAIHPRDRKIPIIAHARAVANRKEFTSYLFRIRSANGEYIWQEDSASFVYDAAGNHEKTYLISRDVTHRILRETEREQLLKDLTASYEELKQFAFITQHNLRAPVANFLGLINLIEGEEIDHPTLPGFVSAMRVTAERFDETIRDLNHVLRIKSRSDVTYVAVDFATAFQAVMERRATEIAHSQAIVTSDFSAGSSAICNEEYLLSIFDIMVDNALQFASPDRRLEIKVKSEHVGKEVILTFRDNGLGLNLEVHHARLFGLYQRFHAHKKSKGLGLYLLKSQVEAVGGSVTVESKVNEGFVLHIRLRAIDMQR